MNTEVPWPRRIPTSGDSEIDQLVQSPARLDAVRKSQLLHSRAEESFDSLTRLATLLTKAPASFVTLVTAEHDFYKSQFGFPAQIADERQLQGRTFCHYTLQSDEPLVIDDTHGNPVWKAVPTVDSMGVRAYVGVPIKLHGQTIGSFCVIDMKPRTWQPDELEVIRQLAISATREISLRHALAAAREEAGTSLALARAREEIVAVVAHDLRTPLQVLQLSCIVLKRGTQGVHDATTDRMLNAINAMKSMADTLLSANALLAQSHAGKQVLAGATLIHDAVDMMSPIADRAGMVLELGELPHAMVLIDYAQMLRVLGNLLGNAIKYSSTGSTVRVHASSLENELRISVIDNGSGMTAEGQSHAFERGWQGGEGMMRGDGAGLGLAIAKTLVEENGGTISLVSEPGCGTTLSLSLPIVPDPPNH